MIRRLPLDVVRRIVAAPGAAVQRNRARHLADVEDVTERWYRTVAELRDIRRFVDERGLMPDYIRWWSARHVRPAPATPGELVVTERDATTGLDLDDIARAVEVLELRAASATRSDETTQESHG